MDILPMALTVTPLLLEFMTINKDKFFLLFLLPLSLSKTMSISVNKTNL